MGVVNRQTSGLNKFYSAISLIALIWLISIFQMVGPYVDIIPRLLPRDISGLPGILSMPFVHGGFTHLISNTIPLFIFSMLISIKGNRYFIEVTACIVFMSGLLLWLMGRGSYHIGASSLIFGYFGFIILRAYYSPSLSAVLISIGVLIFYGSIVLGVIPQGGNISWEGHLFGLISGMIIAKFMKN